MMPQALKEVYREVLAKSKHPIYGPIKKYPLEVRIEKRATLKIEDPFTLKIIYDKDTDRKILYEICETLAKYGIDILSSYIDIQEKVRNGISIVTITSKQPKKGYQPTPKIYGKFKLMDKIYLLNEKGRRISNIFRHTSIRSVDEGEIILKEYPYVEGEKGIDLWGNEVKEEKEEEWKIIKGGGIEIREDENGIKKYYSTIKGIVAYKREKRRIYLYTAKGLEIADLTSIKMNGEKDLELPFIHYLRIGTTDKKIKVSAPNAIVEIGSLETIDELIGREILIEWANRYSYTENDKSHVPIEGERVMIKGEMHYCKVKSKEFLIFTRQNSSTSYISNTEIYAEKVMLNKTYLGNVKISPPKISKKVDISMVNTVVRDSGIVIINPGIEKYKNVKGSENISVVIVFPELLNIYDLQEFKKIAEYIPLNNIKIINKKTGNIIPLTHSIYNDIINLLHKKEQTKSSNKEKEK